MSKYMIKKKIRDQKYSSMQSDFRYLPKVMGVRVKIRPQFYSPKIPLFQLELWKIKINVSHQFPILAFQEILCMVVDD